MFSQYFQYPNICMAPTIHILLTIFPIVYFTSSWLFCNCQFVLLTPFTFFTQFPTSLPCGNISLFSVSIVLYRVYKTVLSSDRWRNEAVQSAGKGQSWEPLVFWFLVQTILYSGISKLQPLELLHVLVNKVLLEHSSVHSLTYSPELLLNYNDYKVSSCARTQERLYGLQSLEYLLSVPS